VTSRILARPADLSVVVVDDEPSVRLAFTRMLQRLGVVRIESAANAADALQAITTPGRRVDLVICDLSMPTADGLLCLRWLADLERPPAVILVSGHERLLLESARRLGESLQLRILGAEQKPVTAETLQRLLEGLETTDADAVAAPAASVVLSADDVRRSVDAGWIELWFQPQFRLSLNRVTGVEALMRLRHPTLGLLAPESFIPAAESAGLIGALTDLALVAAVEWSARWRTSGHQLTVALNLSKAGLMDLTLPDRALYLCRTHDVAPADITFELTESSLAAQATVLLDIAARLRLKGFRLSLDDFGTGYASLAELQSLPFHELKLDRQFVQGALPHARALGIQRSSIAQAAELGLSTVAEGVETESMLALVSGLGCQIIQGYFIARPMPADRIGPWLIERSWAVAAAPPDAGRPGQAPVAATTPPAASSEIVSRFAHDLASPLFVLLSLSELMRDDEPSPKRKKDWDEIHKAATEISEKVKALRRQILAAASDAPRRTS
jgi:EAL domain-containing protein (putative c-di-GMP-specific phosphodiesterase class I)/ActR/RegA family two-component response regulator